MQPSGDLLSVHRHGERQQRNARQPGAAAEVQYIAVPRAVPRQQSGDSLRCAIFQGAGQIAVEAVGILVEQGTDIIGREGIRPDQIRPLIYQRMYHSDRSTLVGQPGLLTRLELAMASRWPGALSGKP